MQQYKLSNFVNFFPRLLPENYRLIRVDGVERFEQQRRHSSAQPVSFLTWTPALTEGKSAEFEFVLTAGTINDFFPIRGQFSVEKSYSGIKVISGIRIQSRSENRTFEYQKQKSGFLNGLLVLTIYILRKFLFIFYKIV